MSAVPDVIPLVRCPHGNCGRRATTTVGDGVPACERCAASIRSGAAQIFAAKEQWEAAQRRAGIHLMPDNTELPLAASGET
ncbi:MAG: hypothetical protein ACYC0B_01990 [Gemmatimonadaceae bacterium]